MARTEPPLSEPHPAPPVWARDLLLAVLVVGPAFAPFLPAGLLPASPVSWVAALAPVIVLPARRRWPLGVLVVLVLLFAGAVMEGTVLPGAGIAIAAAVFHHANHTVRRRSLIVGSVTMVALAGVAILGAVMHGLDPLVFQLVVTVAFASAAGDATRSRREYLIAVTERADRAERTRESEAQRRVTEERLRIARDLHDAVAHQISVISLNAGVATSVLDSNPERARAALGTIRQASRNVLGEIGDLLAMLRADSPDSSTPTPQYGLEHLDTLLDQFAAGGLEVRRRVDGDYAAITGTVGLVAYRVIQEALTNAHKHGALHRAHLLIETDGRSVRIVVTNPVESAALPGRTAADPGATGTGMGLVGVRERVASVRGTVSAGPTVGGWKMVATIPLPKEGRS